MADVYLVTHRSLLTGKMGPNAFHGSLFHKQNHGRGAELGHVARDIVIADNSLLAAFHTWL